MEDSPPFQCYNNLADTARYNTDLMERVLEDAFRSANAKDNSSENWDDLPMETHMTLKLDLKISVCKETTLE